MKREIFFFHENFQIPNTLVRLTRHKVQPKISTFYDRCHFFNTYKSWYVFLFFFITGEQYRQIYFIDDSCDYSCYNFYSKLYSHCFVQKKKKKNFLIVCFPETFFQRPTFFWNFFVLAIKKKTKKILKTVLEINGNTLKQPFRANEIDTIVTTPKK